jgi:hypothetical protein
MTMAMGVKLSIPVYLDTIRTRRVFLNVLEMEHGRAGFITVNR